MQDLLLSIDKKLGEVLQALDRNGFDMVRLSEAKERLGVCGTTLRQWEKDEGFGGIYDKGRCAFVSKIELEKFLKQKGTK